MKKILIIALTIIVISFIIGVSLYSYFPDRIASHWGPNGEVNGYMPKFLGLFLMPIISIGIFILFYFIPKLDPLKKNYQDFQKYYDSFILIMIIFLFYIHILTILWNLHVVFNMNHTLIPALGFLFFYIGILVKNLKRNWFIGIRTPWTISNDKVWKKTHILGSNLFMISGVITLFGIFLDGYFIWLVLVPILISSIWLVIYSYLEWRKEQKKK